MARHRWLHALLLAGCAPKQPVVAEPLPEPIPETPVPLATPAQSVAPASQAALPAPAEAPPPTKPAATLDEALTRARAAGFGAAAEIVALRVRQERRKMKLEPDEGLRAANYLSEELPEMQKTRELLVVMPKTTVELVRSVRERGVLRSEAERMAEYLSKLHGALEFQNPAPFDENCSHVIGREWHEIDYRGEGMTWENQKRIYARHGVVHFRDLENLERFFRVESKASYFQKLYRPAGAVP
jgi:hypothetical protein